MSKYSKAERDKMVEEARRLYIKGFDIDTISRYVGVSPDTIRKWIREFGFEHSKKTNIIQRPEIIESLLQSFQDVLDGNKPKIKPLEAAQYASAFEKLSDKKKLLSYAMEAYDELTDEIIKGAEKERKEANKKRLFTLIQDTRVYMDKVVARLSQEVLHD